MQIYSTMSIVYFCSWKKNGDSKVSFFYMKMYAVSRSTIFIHTCIRPRRGTSHVTQSDLPSIIPSAALRFLGVDPQALDVGKTIDINRTLIATFISKYFGK